MKCIIRYTWHPTKSKRRYTSLYSDAQASYPSECFSPTHSSQEATLAHDPLRKNEIDSLRFVPRSGWRPFLLERYLLA